MKIIDLHNHTNFSYDGHDSAYEVVENAARNGVDIIGITDHQFSIGDRIGEYIAEMERLKEKYKDHITVLCGLEIGTRPRPQDFPAVLSEKLDYCLFESLDDDRAMDLYEFFEWKRLFKCDIGLAHTDIFKLCEKYGVDLLKILKRDNIFWEINFSGNYTYYYDFITSREKQRMISESGIKLSVGSDLHWIGDFDLKRLVQTNELAARLKNPLPLGITY
ncbi:MAG: PHP domain-containing protein [Clostridia bacterium]|nr:PHP domain-containing protein [Clostridia bacterium]